MNTKERSLPGFNAETSLYRTGNQYRLAGCSVHAASCASAPLALLAVRR
jgi:hypothetical protein